MASQVLDLALSEGELRATLTHPGPEAGPVRTFALRDFDEARVRGLVEDIIAVLNRANRWGDMDQGSLDLLRQHGALLFDEALPTPVKNALRGAPASELTLVLDEALVFVPWELMHTGHGFVGLDHAVGRIVKSRQTIVGRPRPRPEAAWRMLILCDPRGDLMGSYYEGVTLRDELDGERERLAVDMRSSEVGVTDVKRLVREYDIIHYAGHAEMHPDRPNDSGWLLSDGNIDPGALLDLAGGRPFPRLVFSNACRSGRVDGPLLAADQSQAVFGLANAFLLSGVRHYVGTLWDVPDEPACHFSLAFYDALLAGETLGAAMQRARRALCERYGPDTVLWASYVLYGEPAIPYLEAASLKPPRARAAERPAPPPSARDDSAGYLRPRPAVTRVRGAAVVAQPGATSDDLPLPSATSILRWMVASAALALVLTLLVFWSAEPVAERVTVERRAFEGAHLTAATYPVEHHALIPAAEPESPTISAAAAAAAPEAEAQAPTSLQVLVQGDDGAGVVVDEDDTLHSWENFQLRFRLAEPGHVTVWHVESQGNVRSIMPSAEGQLSARAEAGGWIVLPAEDTWYYLDDRRGKERFVLAVRAGAEGPEPEALLARVKAAEADLIRARRALVQIASEEPLIVRGVGGTRSAPPSEARAAERRALQRLEAALRDHYDEVHTVEFNHR